MPVEGFEKLAEIERHRPPPAPRRGAARSVPRSYAPVFDLSSSRA